jgi:hypothetical protein
MPRKNNYRRTQAALLMIAGAMVMILTPESWAGLSLLVLGAAIEVAGIALRRK